MLAPSEDDGIYNAWRAVLPPATATRWATNDDRSVVLKDRVNEHVSISGHGGFSFGPVTIEMTGTSSVADETVQLTTVREQLSAVEGSHTLPYPWTPQNGDGSAILLQTNFVATSETKNTPTITPIELKAQFDMVLDLPLLPPVAIHWEEPFFKLETSTTTPAAQIAEGRRLRVGEYSDWGTDFMQEGQTGRVVMSHLPTTASPGSPDFFTSWPSGAPDRHDLNACLADTTIPDLPDPPDPGQPGDGPGTGSLCWYGPEDVMGPIGAPLLSFDLPNQVCENSAARSAFLGTYSGAWLACLTGVLDYLCSGSNHKEQVFGTAGQVVARVYDHAADAATVGNIFTECVEDTVTEANPPSTDVAKQLAEAYAKMFRMGACDANANLTSVAP